QASSTDLASPAGKILQAFWVLFGANQAVTGLAGFDAALVGCFFGEKLRTELTAFTDQDLELLEHRYRDKPMQRVVAEARGRRLAWIANNLLKNPAELSRDVTEVKRRVADYHFNPDLNE